MVLPEPLCAEYDLAQGAIRRNTATNNTRHTLLNNTKFLPLILPSFY
jgi:hypothetical protein